MAAHEYRGRSYERAFAMHVRINSRFHLRSIVVLPVIDAARCADAISISTVIRKYSIKSALFR